jgi:hypothetical protein
MAAIALELADPHTSVTFISFACSGASINTPNYDPESLWEWPASGADPAKHLGTGVLGHYRGAETDVPYSAAGVGYIPAQMDQLRNALSSSNGQTIRQIDALIISGGGNDIHFGEIAAACAVDGNCWDLSLLKEDPHNDIKYTPRQLIKRALKITDPLSNPDGTPNYSPYNLPDNYDQLAAQVNALNPAPAHVYLNQYMDQTRHDGGGYCPMLEDVFWPLVVTSEEAREASQFALHNLNQTLRTVAQKYQVNHWQLVDGITSFEVDPLVAPGTDGLFVKGPDGKGHGYCASDNWVIRAEESELIQGPLNWRPGTRGTLHPTIRGHQVYKERLLRYMLPDLMPQRPQDPPQFSLSFSSGGLTDVPGTNGWYIGSQDSNNSIHNKVVVQAVATSTGTLNGAAISVNGTNGCSLTGVTCTTTSSADMKQVTMSVDITASGTYQFLFSAQDTSGQISFTEQEIKVDLEDPVLSENNPPFTVEEGGSVVLSASVTSIEEGPLNYEWDLENNGSFETTGEQPTFSAADLDGPAIRYSRVRVTDRAGRSDIGVAEVVVSNVAPTPGIDGILANNPEGTPIHLTGSITDPGTADTFTYAWTVKKDGNNYASGTDADFSFIPGENGSYEVSLRVTDDDGGAGAASQTIDVDNVAPTLSNVNVTPETINEGDSVTLSGDISDPGSTDTFALTIDWGDGSNEETVSEAAGTKTFSLTHTYADDNPTGTASDNSRIALTIEDDDKGTGAGSVNLVVKNLPPTLSIASPAYGALFTLNTAVNISASLTDPNANDTLSCSVDWDDGTTASGTYASGVCSASHTYTVAGVYTLQMTGADDDTGSAMETAMVVIYDPSAGFVTGGGWIDSPAGAYIADPTLAGRANFGFVAKYQRGATVPSGGTQFRFQAGDFYFESEVYEWLVVAGAKAQFKGTGSINDISGFNFLLTLTDGDINGGGGMDKFRIKIWDASGVVYDNLFESPDDMDNAGPQAIGAGNIVIHSTR